MTDGNRGSAHGASGDLDTTFVTFGTADFSQARARYIRSLARFGFTRVLAFDPQSPPVLQARAENPEIFAHVRGYGYWLWKPYIIEAALAQTALGGRVMYTDIALEMVASPARLFELAGDHDVVVFRIGTGMRQREYTKRDAFVLMDADTPQFWDDEQVCGGYMLLRNTPAARDFVQRWRTAMRDPRMLLDQPGTLAPAEHPEFRVHRHDQSIISILATRDRLPILADPSQWGRDRLGHAELPPGSDRFIAVDTGQVFKLHRYRDRPWHRRLARWMRDDLLRRGGA